ncbi:Ig-like domain-containing protein [Chitinophagaceae bacterium MMS25-I14]
MRELSARILIFICIIAFCAGCANIVPPSGGKKDITPPKLLSATPSDSLYNNRFRKLELRFDEYITVSDAATQVQISPLLPIAPTVTSAYKKVTVTIPDTLLQDNTTYRISFGNAIKDLHEGNPMKAYTYIFSTGAYFDSLKIAGKVINATTGLLDSSATIVLYSAKESDSAIVRHKPLYVTKVAQNGTFAIDGLPNRDFKIYALRDKNNNLIYDGGAAGDWIGFTDSIVHPVPDSMVHINFLLFPEGKDTTVGKDGSSGKFRGDASAQKPKTEKTKEGFSYIAAVDTSDVKKRTVEISKPLAVKFNRVPASVLKEKIFLSYDSFGLIVEAPLTISSDTGSKANTMLVMPAAWKEDMVYTLRLIKGFAKDSSGADALPSRYTFHTKRDEDYGKLTIHLPAKYYGPDYVLQVTNDKDTIYQKPVADTMVRLKFLQPSTYTFRVIVDKNHDGTWNTGDLFGKKQPEIVIPYTNSVLLKAGWENIVDFDEQKKAAAPGGLKSRANATTK